MKCGSPLLAAYQADLQRFPLSTAPDECWRSGEQGLLNPGRNDGRLLLQETFVDIARRWIGVDAQFALQDSGAGMVDMQCAGAVVIQHEQAHQTAIEVFGEGIDPKQTPGILDGAHGVAALFKEAQQVFEELSVALMQLVPLR